MDRRGRGAASYRGESSARGRGWRGRGRNGGGGRPSPQLSPPSSTTSSAAATPTTDVTANDAAPIVGTCPDMCPGIPYVLAPALLTPCSLRAKAEVWASCLTTRTTCSTKVPQQCGLFGSVYVFHGFHCSEGAGSEGATEGPGCIRAGGRQPCTHVSYPRRQEGEPSILSFSTFLDCSCVSSRHMMLVMLQRWSFLLVLILFSQRKGAWLPWFFHVVVRIAPGMSGFMTLDAFVNVVHGIFAYSVTCGCKHALELAHLLLLGAIANNCGICHQDNIWLHVHVFVESLPEQNEAVLLDDVFADAEPT